jgi:hypothetical protein
MVAEEEPRRTTTEAMTEPPKSGKSVVATAWPVTVFRYGDGKEITDQGVELSATESKAAFEAAEANAVTLVTIKEVSE